MLINHSNTLNFSANGLNMWGAGDTLGGTWTWQVGDQYSTSGSIDTLGFTADYAVSASASIGAAFTATAGSVDIGCDVVVNASMPDVVKSGEHFVIDTSSWSASSLLNTTGPSFGINVFATFGVDASLTNIQFDAPGFDPVTFEDFSYSLPVDQYTLLDIGPSTPNPTLEFGPFTVGAHLPSINTFGQGGASVIAQDQSDNPFLYGSADLDRLIAYSSGNLAYLLNDPTGSKDILEGTFGEAGGAHLNYTLFDTELTAGLYAVQKFQFNITSIGVTMASSHHGEVQTGELGDAFIFSTPSTGDGSISIDTTYTLNGTLTNDSGIVGNITLDLTALNFEFLWPGLVDVELPGVHFPLGRDTHTPAFYPYQNTETFGGLDTANATYTVNYSESAAPGGGGTMENPPEQDQITFNGTEGDDWLYANGLDNIIRGYAGNDVIYGYSGNDAIYAGEGNDTVNAGAGNDTIEAGGGNDTVYTGSGDDVIDLGTPSSGWKYVDGGAGSDLLMADFSGAGNPLYWQSPSVGALTFESGVGGIQAMLANADETGTLYLVIPYIGPFVETHTIERFDLTGTAANDLVIYRGGTRYDGGAGTDTFYADWSGWTAPVVWDNDPTQSATLNGVAVGRMERLLLKTGSGDDVIRNTQVDSTNDTIDTGAGNDTVEAGGGNDTVYTGSGDDVIDLGTPSSGWKYVDGGAGSDLLMADFSGAGNPLYWQSPSVGALTFESGVGGIQAMLANADETGALYLVIPYIGPFVETHTIERFDLTGTAANDLLLYRGGTRYDGGGGTDTFYADWSGWTTPVTWDNDPTQSATLNGVTVGGLERLLLATGSGDDAIHNAHAATDDYFDTGSGNDTIEAGGGNDTVYAGSGDDTIELDTPNSGWKYFDGGAGSDLLRADFSGQDNPLYWQTPATGWMTAGSSVGDIQAMLANATETGTLYLVIPYIGPTVETHNIERFDLTGAANNDLLLYLGGGRYDGGAGADTFYADWSGWTAPVVWDNDPAQPATLNGVTVSGLERLLLATGSGDDIIRNTRVVTDDYFDTGAGNDTIEAGGGNDTLIGGTGLDTAIYSGHRADYTISAVDLNGSFTVTHNNSGTDGTDTLSGIEKLQFADGTIDAPCFLRGTQLLTRHGYAPVETLQPGDELLTLHHGWQKLIWLGHRHISKNAQGRFDHKVQPIRIVRDAFGVGLPSRDLWVSPEHAVYFRDHLVPAKSLVNGVTVIREPDVDAITYYHVLLERHSVVFSESLPTESYTPQENLDLFENTETCPEPWRSDAAAFIGRWAECRPRTVSGPVIETARAYLAQQISVEKLAKAMGA